MDEFKKTILNDYGWEMSISKEYGKKKLKREDKKRLRKLSRTRLKKEVRQAPKPYELLTCAIKNY